MEDCVLDDILRQIRLENRSSDDDEPTCSSLERYNNMEDVFAKKLVDLQSSNLDRSESGVCMRCNKDGSLLNCAVNGCSIVVHEKCMNCKPQFDETGKFHCPSCWYKRHAARARELLNKVMEEKKALLDFMDSNMACGSTDMKSHMESRKNMEKAVKLEDRYGEEEYFSPNERSDCCLNEKADERLTSIGSLDEEMPVKPLDKHIQSANLLNGEEREDEAKTHEDDVPLTVRRRRVSARIEKLASRQHPDSTVKKLNSPSKTETREKRKKCSLFREQEQSTRQKLSIEKRKKFYWKPEEEDMLKEGVLKFMLYKNKNISWRKIMEFGHHVFDSTRTPTDLKDKWRSMMSKDSKLLGIGVS